MRSSGLQPDCAEQGYTSCALGDYSSPEGTSFAAPQVAAAAAVLFGVEPSLTSSQVTRILERHTNDVNAQSGCNQCPNGRDKFSGWGSLDVTKAVDFLSSGSPPPASDRFEPNDKPSQAQKLWGKRPAVDATLDRWDDPVDVYRVRLERGQRLGARVAAHWAHAKVSLSVFGKGAGKVVRTARPGTTQRLSYRALHTGWYDVKLRTQHHGGGRYALELSKSG